MTEAPPAVIREVQAALREQGLGACRLVPLSRFQGTKRGRYAFLAEADDGSPVKVRHLAAVEVAEQLERLREGLEPAFAPVLARHGPVLTERWIEGRTPTAEEAEARAEEAGALLGRLHARPAGSAAPAEQGTAGYRASAEADLEQLSGAGELTERETASLLSALGRLDPGSFRSALIHRDFCAENFLIDDRDRLVVIDNEWFEVGAPGFDLGRTFHRWPMSEDGWRRFLAGYGSAAAEPEALDFWTIASTLFGARVYLRVSPPQLPPLLALLRQLSEGRRLLLSP